MIKVQENKIFDIIRRCLQSYALIPLVFGYAFLCWYFSSSSFATLGCSVVVALILFFCKDVGNIYALIFYTPFFIQSIYAENSWGIYLICIVLVVVSLAVFLTRLIVAKKSRLKLGKMFPAIVLSSVVFMLSGVVGRFNFTYVSGLFGGLAGRFTYTLTIFAFSAVTLLLYFIAKNSTQNLGKRLAVIFVTGAAFITAEICIFNIRSGDLFYNAAEPFFSSQHKNVGALYIMLGICGSFYLGFKRKYDFAIVLPMAIFLLGVYLTNCRMILALSGVLCLVAGVFLIIYSPKKFNYLWLFGAFVVVACVVGFTLGEQIMAQVQKFLNKLNQGLNGRGELWPYCFERFLELPVLGYGFVGDGRTPGVHQTNQLLAHNTLLQWLTSVGLLGTALLSYFYIVKYKCLFGGFNSGRLFFVLAVIAIELSGITDQAASMDIFTYLLSIIIICGAEEHREKALPTVAKEEKLC